MRRIEIRGGQICHTDNLNTVYEVLSGEALAYIVPLADGRSGRRLLLGSFTPGERIPGFAHSSTVYGSFALIIAALGSAELMEREDETDDALLYAFAERAGLPFFSGRGQQETATPGSAGVSDALKEQFTEALIEKYNRNEVKQDGYIYASVREKEATEEKIYRSIYNAFQSAGAGRPAAPETGNALYDAVAVLCAREKIDIASNLKVEESSGRRYDLYDIARVSHFCVRQVILEGNWYRQDCGSFLAFLSDKKTPVACIPRGPGRYAIYNPKTGEYGRLTGETAHKLMPQAFMLYRPLPDKPMGLKDILRFGLDRVFPSDILRLVVMTLLGILIGLLIPIINEQAYDRFIPMGETAGLLELSVLLLSCGVGGISFAIVKNLASLRSMGTMKYAVQSAVFDRLFKLPESFYREYDAATLGKKALQISRIYTVLSSGTVAALVSALFSLLYLTQMLLYSRELSVIAILLTGIAVVVILVLGRLQAGYEKEKLRVDAEAESLLFQSIKGISKLKMAGAEERALLKYIEKLVYSQQVGGQKDMVTGIVTTITAGTQLLFSIVLYSHFVLGDLPLSVGAFSAFMSAFGAFSAAMISGSRAVIRILQLKPCYDEVQPILEALPESTEEAGMPGELTGEIEISNVTFGYDQEEEPVLRDVSLHIAAGEYVGIVGVSGCGKSTLLKLMLGFEKPRMGRIFYDSQDIDGLDKRELRKKFGVVLQDGGLIPGSIYENITITSPEISLRRVEETIGDVGLTEDIRSMPMGLHTIVSEEAGTISGGQRQRILIARAIAGRPGIIFLDEATSALDNETQARIVETLERLPSTKVVIAHRLSTVKNCDRILVMDQGRIREEGSYQELMAKKGLFYELAERQLLQ